MRAKFFSRCARNLKRVYSSSPTSLSLTRREESATFSESQFTMSADLTPDQKSTVKSLFAEISESEATCAALVASEKARQAELITKLHAVAGPRPYSFEGKTVTPVVRAKKGSTTGEKEAFLRGRTVPEVTSLD